MIHLKKSRLITLALLLVTVLFVQESLAQDYTRWGLPEGALARLGKGSIGDGDRAVAYSPDGTQHSGGQQHRHLALRRQHRCSKSPCSQDIQIGGHFRGVFTRWGDTLASGSNDNTLRLWNANTGQVKHTLT